MAFPLYFAKKLIDHDLYLTTHMLIHLPWILIRPVRVCVHTHKIQKSSYAKRMERLDAQYGA